MYMYIYIYVCMYDSLAIIIDFACTHSHILSIIFFSYLCAIQLNIGWARLNKYVLFL